jgi:tRNA-dihydrouridine synthase B
MDLSSTLSAPSLSSVNFNGILAPSRYFLAPMAGVTNSPFRHLMRLLGAGIVTSELISSHGILTRCERTMKMASFHPKERPIGIQIFGQDLEVMIQSAQVMQELEPDFIDVNLGCPVPKVTKKGAGSALLRDPVHLGGLLEQLKKNLDIPLTIKIRTGWDASSITAHEVVHVAAEAGVSYVAIHGRTRAQKYEGKADWNLIGEVKTKAKIPIIGNGDILSAEQALKRRKESGCDGVMIGRGALGNPWIFKEINALEESFSPIVPVLKNYPALLEELRQLVENSYEKEGFRSALLKKYAGWFSHGLPRSAPFRNALFKLKTYNEVLAFVSEFFAQLPLPSQTFEPELFFTNGHG